MFPSRLLGAILGPRGRQKTIQSEKLVLRRGREVRRLVLAPYDPYGPYDPYDPYGPYDPDDPL